MRKYRHEDKYLIDAAQQSVLVSRARALLSGDLHAGMEGCYMISSLYFDDLQNSCYYEKEDGEMYREKYRIRIYDQKSDVIKLEKKVKNRDLTAKEVCTISGEQCRSMMTGHLPHTDGEVKLTALLEQMKLRRLLPQVIVTYVREPYVYPAGNVRVTFDREITTSAEVGRFLDGDYIRRPILSSGVSVMEVKWDEFLPAHIRQGLQIDGLQRVSFSKYCHAREMEMRGGIAA